MNEIYVPESSQPRVVIIGGGFAGIHLAKALKNKAYQVVLMDKNNFHQFQPLFYQVATSGLEPDAISFPLRKIFRKHKNVYFRMADVESIDTIKQVIVADTGTLHYDYLVLATGTGNNFYGLENVSQNAIGLKSIRDALDIRSSILENLELAANMKTSADKASLTHIVICGGGPAGVEMAGAFAEFRQYVYSGDYKDIDPNLFQIYLIEASDRLLSAMSQKSSDEAYTALKKLGVQVFTGKAVKDYSGQIVQLSDGTQIESTNLIWTAGVQGNIVPGIHSESIVRGNRFEVDEQLKIKGYSNVYAIGDIALQISEEYPKGHPQVAAVAIQQGEYLAKMFALPENKRSPFTYFDKGSLATIGKRNAVMDTGKVHLKGYLGWFIWATVHLYSISGFTNRLRVGLNWMSAYFSYDKSNRLIIRRYRKGKS